MTESIAQPISMPAESEDHQLPMPLISSRTAQIPAKTTALKNASTLPEKVLEIILKLADAETFTSLILLNRHWYSVANKTELLKPKLEELFVGKSDLEAVQNLDNSGLRRHLAHEAKKRLFPAYRPTIRTFRFKSSSTGSSIAIPHAESLSFAFSPRGALMVAYNYAHVFILDVGGTRPVVKRRLIRKSPSQARSKAVCITEDGKILALLSPEGRVNIFNLGHISECTRIASIQLQDLPVKSIAVTRDGSVLAAARSGSVEIMPTAETSQAMPSRRVACEAADHITFSDNGLVLLVTSRSSLNSSTTFIQAPLPDIGFVDDALTEESLDRLWTSQPLFPTTVGDSSHSALLSTEPLKVVAYDALASAFGILDIQSLKFSNSVFGPYKAHLSTSLPPACSLPAIDHTGEFLALAFENLGVLIGVIEQSLASDQDGNSLQNPSMQWLPQFRHLKSLQWVPPHDSTKTSISSRLVATLPTSDSADSETSEHGSVDGGSILILDFEYRPVLEEVSEIVVDLSQGTFENLDESEPVAELQRSPTQSSQRPMNPPIARSVTSGKRSRPLPQPVPLITHDIGNVASNSASDVDPTINSNVDLGEPYSPAEPRSRDTLDRAATAAATNRTPRHAEASSQDTGRPQVPHESDADNWVPPPPMYAKESESELPEGLKQSLLPLESVNTPELGQLPQPDVQGPTAQTEETTSAEAPPATKLRPPRVRGAVQNARKSLVLQGSNLRRIFSPNNTREAPKVITKPAPESFIRPREAIPTPRQPLASAARERPVSMGEAKPRRHSLLMRPVSMAWTGLTGEHPTAENEELPPPPVVRADIIEPRTPPQTPPPHPESPSLPNPEQIERLHRRQASSSMYSLHSEGTAPRAAIGAYRSNSASPSPWASSVMLGESGSGTNNDADNSPNPRTTHLERRQRTQSNLRTNSNLANASSPSPRGSTAEQSPQPGSAHGTPGSRSRLAPIRSVASLLSAARTHSNSERNGGGSVTSKITQQLPAKLGGPKRRNTLKRRSSVRAGTSEETHRRSGDLQRESKSGGKCAVM